MDGYPTTIAPLQVFNSPMLGGTRAIACHGTIWFLAEDVTTNLGFQRPNNAIAIFVKPADKAAVMILDETGSLHKAVVVNVSGLQSLVDHRRDRKRRKKSATSHRKKQTKSRKKRSNRNPVTYENVTFA